MENKFIEYKTMTKLRGYIRADLIERVEERPDGSAEVHTASETFPVLSAAALLITRAQGAAATETTVTSVADPVVKTTQEAKNDNKIQREAYAAKAVKLAGGVRAMARSLGVPWPKLKNWPYTGVPAKYAIQVCRLVNNAVTPHQLAPEFYPEYFVLKDENLPIQKATK